MGATLQGRKALLGVTDGARESAQDRRELLLDLKSRGLAIIAPELALSGTTLDALQAERRAADLRG